MYTSKVIQLLKTLNTSEKEALKKWVHSPLHTQHKKSIELILILLEKRKLTIRNTQKKKLFTRLFQEQIYQEKKINHIISYCGKIVEQFIEFSLHYKYDFYAKKTLIEYLDTHQLEKYAHQHLRKLEKVQQEQKIQNQAYFQQQYQLEEIIFERQNVTKRSNHTNLQAVLDNQYIAFVLDTLYYACETITHQQLYESTYHIPLLDPILKIIQNEQYQNIPAIQLYYYCYMTLSSQEGETYFNTLRKLLIEYKSVLNTKEIKRIYLIAINYCVRQLNNGIEEYVRTVFELFEYGLEHKFLLDDDQLNHFTYKNIMTAAIRLQEFEWTTLFIEKYTPKLALEHQDNYRLFAQSKLLFAQKKYQSCLQLLSKVEFSDLFLNMNAKSMLIKIYYEQQYWEALDALIISFKRFLQRKHIISHQRKIYQNMLYLLEKIIATPTFDLIEKEKLRIEINQTSPLTEKPWLLQQLENM
jgi:hypothetical protein